MSLDLCPGLFCGRYILENGDFSDCGACPRGYKRNTSTHICQLCDETPAFYDWFYLGFMVLLALVLHWFFIDMVSMKRNFSKDVMVLHMTALLEISLGSLFTVLSLHPVGLFEIRSCKINSLADWYTLLHNPSPNFEDSIHCTQEATYPLYTAIFIFYGYALAIMLLIRPWVCRKYLPRQSKMSIYAAMYFMPILALIHALIGGLLYYSFPYLVIILSVISIAAHFAIKIDQSITSLIVTSVTCPRNVVILLGHWLLHAYGIIAITQFAAPMMHLFLILLVPLPTLFYIFTAKFTDPNKFTYAVV